ncbi:MAG TPA: hypothetical protein VFX60_11930 [Micromonospora sp.]|nr:hypothetical protein [Micromonospora sp.]
MSQTSEMLRQRETEWAPLLRSVSLVAEIDAPEDEVKSVLRALGQIYWHAHPYDRYRVLRYRYPACLVTGMAGIGAVGYQHGNYWRAVQQETGIPFVGDDQALWGEAFRTNLDHFHLARFPGLPQINVSEILMHAGIPAYCLGDLLNLLLQRQARDPGLSAEDFLAWALMPGRDSRLSSVDKPVQRFIRHGGDYAEDLIDRCLDLLERLRQPGFNADGLGLPAHLIAKAQELAEAGHIVWSGALDRGNAATSPAQLRPYLHLEPYGRGLLVWLPPVHDAHDGQVIWRLRADGEVDSVVSRSPWPGETETAPATTMPVLRPVRQLNVELAGYDREYDLDLVDPRDPLLVFTEDGRRVPATSSLAPEPVWLLYPQKADSGEPLELHVDGDLGDTDEVPAPYGWLGWTLRRADLRAVAELRLGNGTRRRVKGARRAQLQLAKPLPGVSSLSGAPVITAAPMLTLPTDPGVTTEWSIRIRRPGNGEILSSERIDITDDTTVDPWRGLDRPLVGPYETTVRGPLGRGLSRTLEFAEGVRISANPSWREIRPDGLEPATVRISPQIRGLTVQPTSAPLGPGETTSEFQLQSLSSATTVRVTPEHMAVQRLGVGTRSEWSLQPLRLDTETISEGELLIRLPHVLPAQLIVRAGGNELQTVDSRATYGQPLARFPLAAIADTVTAQGSAQLEVRLNGQDYPVARCMPRRLASSVKVEDDRLVLVEGVRVEGLVAGLYQVYAPWRPPHVVHLNADLASDPLPPDVITAGPLAVLLRVEDPWLPTDWPDWPSGDNVFDIDQPWLASGSDPAADAVSGHLAGSGDLPERPDIAPLLFQLYPHADGVRRRGVVVDVRTMVATLLGRHPAAALASLTTIRTSADLLVAPLVHSGLITAPPAEYLSEPDEIRLWTVSPLAGLLATAHRLPDIAAKPELREQIIAVCGDVAGRLLASEPDPYAPVGRFDSAAQHFARLSEQERDQVWKAMRVVPGGLLDADERLVAARQLFDVRIKPGLGHLSRRAENLLLALQGTLDKVGGPAVTAAVRARQTGRGWLALPALSLAFAFVARLAARGHTSLEQLLPEHARLARSAPRLVTIDLLLAEFILTGARTE